MPKVETKKSLKKEVVTDEMHKKYVYMLSEKSQPRGMVYEGLTNTPIPENPYRPWHNLLLKCSIIWDGSTDPFSGKPRSAGKHLIQYYDGCTTLFVDNQPQDRQTREELISNTIQRVFQRGKLEVYGYDTLFKTYCDWSAYNVESPYRSPRADAVFVKLDNEKEHAAKNTSIDNLIKAIQWATEASDNKMIVHARYLGVPEIDFISGNELPIESIRTLYREAAKDNPNEFIRSYTDTAIEVKFWIDQALQSGEISTTMLPNQAAWRKSAAVICDISGLRSHAGILDRLIEYSLSSSGEEFVLQLKALYS